MSKVEVHQLVEALADLPGITSKPIDSLNERIRTVMGPRGGRFAGDHADICMVIERSRNINVVVYRTNFVKSPAEKEAVIQETLKAFYSSKPLADATQPPSVHAVQQVQGDTVTEALGTCHVNANDSIHPYWINLVPSYIAARRKKGIMHDTSDLKFLEKKLAYGCTATPYKYADFLAAVGKAGGKSSGKSEETAAAEDGADSEAKRAEWLKSFFASVEPHCSSYVALPKWNGLMLALPPLPAERAASVDKGRQNEIAKRHLEESQTPQSEKDRRLEAEKKLMEEEGNDWHMESAKGVRHIDTCKATNSLPVIVTMVGGVISVLEKVFVKSIEPKHFFQLPTVEYVEAFGFSLLDGSATYEKLLAKN